MTLDGTGTAPYIAYQNGVSFLSDSGNDASALADLNGWKIAAFEGASHIIPGLADAIPQFGSYRELADQIIQSRLLFGQRIDGTVGDGMLFAEFRRQLQEAGASAGVDANQSTEFRAIFEPTEYGMSFRDPAIAADFDRCFAELDAAGTITEINVRWLSLIHISEPTRPY